MGHEIITIAHRLEVWQYQAKLAEIKLRSASLSSHVQQQREGVYMELLNDSLTTRVDGETIGKLRLTALQRM